MPFKDIVKSNLQFLKLFVNILITSLFSFIYEMKQTIYTADILTK